MSLTRADFGTAVKRDPRTGDVHVDRDGNLITIEGITLAIQECRVALESIKGEDIFDMEWGFPLLDVINNPWNVAPEILIPQAIIETLAPERIPLLDYVEVTNLHEGIGEDEGQWSVEVLIRTINQDQKIIGADIPNV